MTPRPDHLMVQSGVLVRRTYDGPPDAYGDPTWLEERTPTRCALLQEGSREDQGGQVQLSSWRLFLPAEAPCRGWDALELDGDAVTYELDGDAWQVLSLLSGEPSHVEARVTRAE